MVARVITAAPVGFNGQIIEVESDTKKGLPSLQIVGLGNRAIDEAKERVRSAITNSFLEFPVNKIVINLAPAELSKDGTHYDLPIALSILCVSGQLQQKELDGALFAGELALDGKLRSIRGVVNIVEAAKAAGISRVFIPDANADQASSVDDVEIFAISSIKQLFLHLKQESVITPYQKAPSISYVPRALSPTLDDISGQEQAKRALTIAAAGHHNILLSGSPGAGKTMLAKALVNLLPPLSSYEQLAVTKLHSLSGEVDGNIIKSRPFRSPHHTASPVSIIGGGTHPKPGEISLAHTGVLFLDEIPEYPRSTLEALRQPLEDKKIVVTRANSHITYPADFMLVATMNPCPCGYFGDSKKECTCAISQVLAYKKRLSGPLLDRIDLMINVSRVSNQELSKDNSMNKTQHNSAYALIERTIKIQSQRYKSSLIYNGSIDTSLIKKLIKLPSDSASLLASATDKLSMTARSYFKIIKVARTIADLEGAETIKPAHISEALQYRESNP